MNAPLHAGMLRERVRFEQAVRSADGLGGFTTMWQLYAERWAYVERLSGADKEQGDARTVHITSRLITRRDDALTAAMRCIIHGAPHRIEWVAPYGTDGMFTECRATQISGATL
jgi:SPP1 family predicted phage head-tail adaptor